MFFSWFSNETTDPKHKDKELCPATFFCCQLFKKSNEPKKNNQKLRNQKQKKTGKTRLHPPKGGDEDAERPPLALDPLLEVFWLPPMGQGVRGLDFCRFLGLEGILLETFLLDLF